MSKKWQKLKDNILGKKFDLSVVFADDNLLKKLNRKYRKKNKTTSVLSFPLSKQQGEIFLNKRYKRKKYLNYLFIHSLLHLKGYRHGTKMEKEEKKILEKNYGKKYNNWD